MYVCIQTSMYIYIDVAYCLFFFSVYIIIIINFSIVTFLLFSLNIIKYPTFIDRDPAQGMSQIACF
jgi:hypothetical protein